MPHKVPLMPKAGRPHPSVGFSLSQLGLATSRGFAELVGTLGLEPRQFAVLRAAAQSAGQPQQALAERLGIPASTMVGLLDGLEHAGLVHRRRAGTDRRVHTIELTERGAGVLHEAMALAEAREAQLCAGLSAAERRALLGLLARVAANLGIEPEQLPDRGEGHRAP